MQTRSVAHAAALLALGSTALAAAAEAPPWRGSAVIYRNEVSVNAFDRSADLTYNPYYAMSLSLRPRWWFGEHLHVLAQLDVVRELTEADTSTYADETVVGDLLLGVGASRILTLPVVEVDVSADLLLTLPTSKPSQARTLALGVLPGVRLSRRVALLEGLDIGYIVRGGYLFHEYTTAQRETPLVRSCAATGTGCDPFLNTGLRNTEWRLAHGLDVQLTATEWLSAAVGFHLTTDWLYGIRDRDPRVSDEPLGAQDQRHGTSFALNLTARPWPGLAVALGYQTVSPQLAPDSSYYNPLYNRYSTLYLDLRLEVDGLIDQVAAWLGKDA